MRLDGVVGRTQAAGELLDAFQVRLAISGIAPPGDVGARVQFRQVCVDEDVQSQQLRLEPGALLQLVQ